MSAYLCMFTSFYFTLKVIVGDFVSLLYCLYTVSYIIFNCYLIYLYSVDLIRFAKNSYYYFFLQHFINSIYQVRFYQLIYFKIHRVKAKNSLKRKFKKTELFPFACLECLKISPDLHKICFANSSQDCLKIFQRNSYLNIILKFAMLAYWLQGP